MDETRSILTQSVVVTAAAILAIAGIFGAYYWYDHQGAPQAVPAPAAPAPEAATPPQVQAEPQPTLVIDDRDSDHVTPLDGSDGKVLEALGNIGGWSAATLHLLLTKDLVRHLVATVDALPREKLPSQAVPLRPVGGGFSVTTHGATSVIAAGNAHRYDPYVKAASALDMRGLAGVYRHFYPQFQQAYRELGYPKGNFNERLVEVIDELLDAPEPAMPPEVTAPGVMYRFVDAELEALPAGQKMLVRIGPANEGIIKSLLRQFRQAVVG